MKKFSVLLTVLVLTISMFTGCGCTRRGAQMETTPPTEMTILPTNIPETTAPVIPTMPPTEAPTEVPTETETTETWDGSITDGSVTETESARSRMH